MKMPMLGRSGHLLRRRAAWSAGRCAAPGRAWPAPGWHRRSRTARSTCSRYQRRNFCALTTSDPGTIAPEIRRSRMAGSKSRARVRRRSRCRAAPSAVVMTKAAARARAASGISISRVTPSALATARHGGQRLRRGAALEIAAGDGDAQAADAAPRAAAAPARRGRSAADGVLGIVALHGVVGERQVRAWCAPAAPDDRGSPRTGRCGRATGGRRSASGRTRPQNEAGTRIEPLVSEPSAIGTSPPATAAAGAARGAAGHVRGVVRVARGAVVHVLAGEVVGVLAHVERADEHGAGGLQARDQRGVGRGRRPVAVDLGAGQRGRARPRRTGS